MPSTPNANAVQFANDLVAAADQLRTLLVTFQRLQARQAASDYVSKLNAMSTYTVNADGSQGSTDGAPNTLHPIVGLNVSASNLSAMLGYGVNDTVSFLTGAGTPTYTDRRSAVGAILS